MKRIIYMIAIAVVSAFALEATAQSTQKPISGVDVKVESCQRYSKGVLVNLIITNTTPKNFRLKLPSGTTSGNDKEYALGDNGREYRIKWYELGLNSPGYYGLYRHSAVRAQVYVRDVPQSVKSFRLLDLTLFDKDATTRAESYGHYIFKDLPIEDFANSDDPKASCTYPDLHIKPLSCERVDNKIKLAFLVINKGRIDLNKTKLSWSPYDALVYADNGSSFKGTLNWADVDDPFNIIFPIGVPVKLSITVDSAPLSVKSLQLVSFPMGGTLTPYEFAFRNIPIGWNDSTVSTDSQNN
ncbi:MAG: hypothetical protein J6C77_01205 [Muribaculaceae bacterium]|nr:hypothetical protein [Muribaculaceae bacterium]